MEWFVTLERLVIQNERNFTLIVSVYKGLKHVLAPYKPLYDAWGYGLK